MLQIIIQACKHQQHSIKKIISVEKRRQIQDIFEEFHPSAQNWQPQKKETTTSFTCKAGLCLDASNEALIDLYSNSTAGDIANLGIKSLVYKCQDSGIDLDEVVKQTTKKTLSLYEKMIRGKRRYAEVKEIKNNKDQQYNDIIEIIVLMKYA